VIQNESFLFQQTEPRAYFLQRKKMRWNKISKKIFFCYTERNSELLLFRGMIRNEIPRVFCSGKQPEFLRNKTYVSSTELFFRQKFPTLQREQQAKNTKNHRSGTQPDPDYERRLSEEEF
jgi:hypothetical protein